MCLIFLSVCVLSCRTEKQEIDNYVRITGPTMGTVYECILNHSEDVASVQADVDSLLNLINAAASTYIPTSLISRFNQSRSGVCRTPEDPEMHHFEIILQISESTVKQSNGFFDPTLMPLVNYWGFGYKNREKRSTIDRHVLDSLLSFVGFEHVVIENSSDSICFRKAKVNLELDLSAVAKGYAVDLIASYFQQLGSTDYYVNIGGEIVVSGNNKHGNPWTLGINYPDTSAGLTELFAKLSMNQGAMATSGNYRNFYSNGGQQIAHTINPRSGEATPSDLVSVTLIASDCATADALATACMAMGYQKAKGMIDAAPDVEGFFIYHNTEKNKLEHHVTPGLSDRLKLN